MNDVAMMTLQLLTNICLFACCRFDSQHSQDDRNHLDCFSVITGKIEVSWHAHWPMCARVSCRPVCVTNVGNDEGMSVVLHQFRSRLAL